MHYCFKTISVSVCVFLYDWAHSLLVYMGTLILTSLDLQW